MELNKLMPENLSPLSSLAGLSGNIFSKLAGCKATCYRQACVQADQDLQKA